MPDWPTERIQVSTRGRPRQRRWIVLCRSSVREAEKRGERDNPIIGAILLRCDREGKARLHG